MTNLAAQKAPRARVRWVAPVAVLGIALAVPALVQTSAKADPTLPAITAEKLVADVIAAKPAAMQGEITQTMDIGLPELVGGVQKPSTLDVMNLAQGTHTWRVWYDGQQSGRLALVDGTSEAAIITNPTDTWVWSSLDREAVHSKTPAGQGPREELTVTPAEAAKKLLTTADESTAVTVAGTTTVAGHAAYDLTLTPKDGTTLVKKVSIAVEATTNQPLRVQVYSTRQSDPAVNIGFTSLQFTQPDPSVFTFTAPPGTKVTEKSDVKASKPTTPKKPVQTPERTGQKPTVTGSGWGTVVVANGLGDLTGAPAELTGVLQTLPKVSGDWGSGRIFEGTLFTVVVTDQGRVAAGAVPAAQLYAALK
ncbi:LolA family protein [Aestuariimicrobium soli]|uniref:LolA family protein n=1 Tax=Aestuariimicrobium soli TaxID=2035834 RepID=UPI003EBBCF4C